MKKIQMNRQKLEQYVGNPYQLGGSREYILENGLSRGLRAVDINSGSGLQYTILPDRGMDISLASYKGTNLVYLTCNGETHPAYFEPESFGWLRSFTAGLLTTCGLTYLGSPVNDGGEQLGLHGRYSTTPARHFSDSSGWQGEEYHITYKGTVEEASMFGNKLRMEREIKTVRGQNKIEITDTVTNFGFSPSPFTILYHINLGYPLLSEKAELDFKPSRTLHSNVAASLDLKNFRKLSPPVASFREQVFTHVMDADNQGNVLVTLKNKEEGIAFTLSYNNRQLPYLVQWKMMGQGEYVLGLEPSNVPLKNRKELREENILPFIQPGESRTNRLEIILTDI